MLITLEAIGGAGKECRAWVAEITGRDPQFGLNRKFIQGVRNYAKSNSTGTRGIETTYELFEGRIYEISQPVSWYTVNRRFVLIENNVETVLSMEMVLELLNKRRKE